MRSDSWGMFQVFIFCACLCLLWLKLLGLELSDNLSEDDGRLRNIFSPRLGFGPIEFD